MPCRKNARQIQLSAELSWWRKWVCQASTDAVGWCAVRFESVDSRWGKLRKRNRSEDFILLAYSHQRYRPGGDIWFFLRDGEGWQLFAVAQRFQVSMATFARWKEIRCEGKVWLKIDPNVIMTELNQELHDHHHDSWPWQSSHYTCFSCTCCHSRLCSLSLLVSISWKSNIKTFKL